MIIITWLLSIGVIFGLCFAKISYIAILIIIAAITIIMFFGFRHNHHSGISIDYYASISGLSNTNSKFKVWGALALLSLSLAFDAFLASLFIAVTMGAITVILGGISFRRYALLLCLPMMFVLCSMLAILFQVSSKPMGYFDIQVFGKFVSLTANSQMIAIRLIAKAICGMACLYFIGLTTPMGEIISVLKAAHVPDIIIELMYFIYRYIFVLMDLQHCMHLAAQSRLGFVSIKAQWRTFLGIASNLLVLAFRRISACMDAMEARGYSEGLEFLGGEKYPIKTKQILFCIGYIISVLVIIAIEKLP